MTTSEETRMTRTPAPALSSAEAARVAAFEAAPVPPEVVEASILQAARRVLKFHGHGIGATCLPPCWDSKRRTERIDALASPAPAPQGEDCSPYHSDAFTCSRCQVSR